MANETKTLSQIDPAYAALERAVTKELEERATKEEQKQSKRIVLERKFAARLADRGNIKDALTTILPGATDEDVAKIMDALCPADLVLPTRYDDPVSYTITAGLIDQVRNAATMLGFDQANYGGFCCAPTGSANAMMIPVAIDANNEWKAFVVFESGLLTFIDGIIRLTVAATPHDLLDGETPNDWNTAWDRHKADPKNQGGLRQASADLRAWAGFLKQHGDRKGLAYTGLQEMRPTEARVVAWMVESAELFVTAHEYVHAIAGHDNPALADAFVEKEADRLGAQITVTALSTRPDVNMYLALAGIALAIEAICIDHTADDAHLPPAQRTALVIQAVPFEDPSHAVLATAMMGLYKRIFHDLLGFAAP
jgi:hypothetical protein